MKSLRHGIEYLFVRCVYALIGFVPHLFYPSLSIILGKLACLLTRRRVRIAMDNLQRMLPQSSIGQKQKIIKSVYRNLAGNVLDSVRPAKMVSQVKIDNECLSRFEEIKKRIGAGQAAIFATGHFGAWEILGQYLATQFSAFHYLAFPQSNKLVDDFINAKRVILGGSLVHSHEAPRTLPRLLKQGVALYMIGDQYAGSSGIVIDFLGQPTSYFRGMALYSHHYRVPIVVLFLQRENPGYTLHFAGTIEPNPSSSKDSEITRIITVYSSLLGEYVQRYPDQWLWTHRRWRTPVHST